MQTTLASSLERILDRGGWTRFGLAFALILAVKWPTLLQPPVWDTAMAVFPPALTLVENGFDLLALLGMPGYEEGGPNGHSTSPVTLLTAVVLFVSGGGTPSFLILHLLHFAGAALALSTLFTLARPVLGGFAAGLLSMSVLLHPVFSAQVGYLYLEMPLFLFTVLSLLAWTRQRFWPAVLWATLAYATKETGIIVLATLAVAIVLERRTVREKAMRIARLAVLPVIWTYLGVLAGRIAARATEDFEFVPSLGYVFGGIGQYLTRFLLNVPDLLVFFTVFFLTAIVSVRPIFQALRDEPRDPYTRTNEEGELLVLGYSGLVIVFFLLLFMVALPTVAGFTIILPRYYVIVLPFLLLWLGYAAQRLGNGRVRAPAAVGYMVLSALFLLNTEGALYPSDIDTEGPGNDPPLTERSNAYRRLLSLEIEAIQALEELPDGVPVYYGRYEHYLLTYPGLGYSDGPLSDGHDFAAESLAELIRRDPMPPCVYSLFNYPWLGGDKILGLIRFAEITPGLSAEIVQEFRDGRYVIILARVRSGDADCPA